jgi:hypothetical protein
MRSRGSRTAHVAGFEPAVEREYGAWPPPTPSSSGSTFNPAPLRATFAFRRGANATTRSQSHVRGVPSPVYHSMPTSSVVSDYTAGGMSRAREEES